MQQHNDFQATGQELTFKQKAADFRRFLLGQKLQHHSDQDRLLPFSVIATPINMAVGAATMTALHALMSNENSFIANTAVITGLFAGAAFLITITDQALRPIDFEETTLKGEFGYYEEIKNPNFGKRKNGTPPIWVSGAATTVIAGAAAIAITTSTIKAGLNLFAAERPTAERIVNDSAKKLER